MPKPATYSGTQLRHLLRLTTWQWNRGRAEHHIPDPDAGDRWTTDLADQLAAGRYVLTTALGSIPDCGAHTAAELLTDRLGVDVTAGTIMELARTGRIRTAGAFKGRPLYNGRDLEAVTADADLTAAAHAGVLHTTNAAIAVLNVATRDFGHIVARGWITPATWGPGMYRDAVPLYRAAELHALAAHPGIDWAAIRAVPAGKRSIIPTLPDPTP